MIVFSKFNNLDKEVYRTFGKANVKIYSLEFDFRLSFLLSFFRLDKIILNKTISEILNIIKNEEFDLIRANGMGINFYFAYEISKKLNIPYILSLHNQFDELKKIEYVSLKKD